MDHTVRYLGHFTKPCTRKAFRLSTQPSGFMWVNATIGRLRSAGWITRSPKG